MRNEAIDRSDFSITIIDDDPIVHYIISTLVKQEFPKVIIHSFESALDFLKAYSNSFTTLVILLDINMPKMNGWQLLEKLTPFQPTTPIYIYSSSSDDRDVQRIKHYDFVKGYLVKPLTKKGIMELLDALRK